MTGWERITVAERKRRAAPGRRRERVPIGERVTQAHLDHFCPGGAGFPVTDSGPIGLGPVEDALAGWDTNAARAAGQRCGRCGRPVTPWQDARRRVTGTWVHEACPG
jgi:hypothetical protein